MTDARARLPHNGFRPLDGTGRPSSEPRHRTRITGSNHISKLKLECQKKVNDVPSPIQLRRARSGKIAVLTALLLVVFIGVLACALDTGWMTMTKTQLRAATDSGALAGGTELLPGLGFSAYKTPSEVQAAAVPQSVAYAAENRAGDQLAVYIDGGRDVSMGTGKLNTATGVWEFNWGSTPYNAVRVTGHRDVDGSGNGDEPLPLFAAPVIGTDVANLTVFSTAVILPASGISIPPGSGIGSGLTPFAFERARWDKYFRAQDYYENQLGSDPSLITEDIMDTGTGGNSEEMLFFEWVASGHGNSQHLRSRLWNRPAIAFFE